MPYCALILYTVLVATLLSFPQLDILWDAKDALCAGDLNFVYGSGNAGFPRWSPSPAAASSPPFRAWRHSEDEYVKLKNTGKVVDAVLSRAGQEQCICITINATVEPPVMPSVQVDL